MAVETAYALAVWRFNNGVASLYNISKCLDLEPLYLYKLLLQQRTFEELRKLITNPLNIIRNLGEESGQVM